jgi:glycosyltransferase involved in cell wall biosynthesis
MNYPKITVITPSYNQGRFLEATILSVINQKYPNLEYFVIDGGSTDHSLSIIQYYEEAITFWISEKDKGQSDAINKGFRRATGDIVIWLNSDDQFTPRALHKAAEYFNKYPNVFVIHGRTILFGETIVETVRSCPQVDDLTPYYLASLPFPQPSAFFRREAITKYGLLEQNCHYGMDYDFFLRIALNHEFMAVDDIFSKYLLHQDSKSVAFSKRFVKDYTKVFSKLLRTFPIATDTLIPALTKFGLYEAGNDTYISSKNIDLPTLHQALLLNLKYRLSFYYEDLEIAEIRKICKFIRSFDKKFLETDPEVSAIYMRTRFLGKLPLQVLRSFKKLTSKHLS